MMAGRSGQTRAQLLKRAAEAEREASLLSKSMSGMAGQDAVDRARQLQRLYDKIRGFRTQARCRA